MTIESPFSYLPNNLLKVVVSFLPSEDAWRYMSVCKEWRDLIDVDARWQRELINRKVPRVTAISPKTQLAQHFRNLCTRYLPLATFFPHPDENSLFDMVVFLELRSHQLKTEVLRSEKDQVAEASIVSFLRSGGRLIDGEDTNLGGSYLHFTPLIWMEELLQLPFDDNLPKIFRSRQQLWACPFTKILALIERMGPKKMPQELWVRILEKLVETQERFTHPSTQASSIATIFSHAGPLSKTYFMRVVTKPCPTEIIVALIDQLSTSEVSDELWDLILDCNRGDNELYGEYYKGPMTTLYHKYLKAGHQINTAMFERILHQTKERSTALPKSFSNPLEERNYLEEQFDHPRGRPVYRSSQDNLVEFLFYRLNDKLPHGTLMKCLSCGFHERFIMMVIARVDQVSLAEWRKAWSMGYSKEVFAHLTLHSLLKKL